MLSIPAFNCESMLKVMFQSQHSVKQAQQKVRGQKQWCDPLTKSGVPLTPMTPWNWSHWNPTPVYSIQPNILFAICSNGNNASCNVSLYIAIAPVAILGYQ